MKKRLLLAGLLILAVSVVVLHLAFPGGHLLLIGWFTGQASFAGKPTSYWSRAIREEDGEAKWLLSQGEPEAVPVLCELLRDDEPEVRQEVAMILSGMTPAPPAALAALQRALEEETDRTAFLFESQVLVRLDQGAAPTAWANALRRNPSPKHRQMAADYLKDLGKQGQPAVPALREALNDPDALVRVSAVTALVDIEGPSADLVAPLRQLVQVAEPRTCPMAIRLLARLGPLANSASVDLVGALRNSDEKVRSEAAAALGKVAPENPMTVTALGRALKDDNGYVRTAAIQALAAIGEPAKEVLPALIDALGDRATRNSAARTLGILKASAAPAVPALQRLLHDPDAWFSVQVAKSLWQISHDRDATVPVIRPLLQEPDVSLRLHAAEALWRIDPEERALVPLLREVFDEPGSPHRYVALVIVGELGPEAKVFVPAIVPILSGPFHKRCQGCEVAFCWACARSFSCASILAIKASNLIRSNFQAKGRGLRLDSSSYKASRNCNASKFAKSLGVNTFRWMIEK
jgi:HEAT repeat protein